MGNGEVSELFRTETNKGGHKRPIWNTCEMTYERIPLSMELQVWDQNNYHKDVWCGTATITSIASQGAVEKQEYVLVKRKHDRDEETGKIYVSMKLGYQQQGSLSATNGDSASDSSGEIAARG